MSRIEEFRRLRNKEEYAEAEKNEQILQEAAADFHKSINNKYYEKQAPLRYIKNKCEFTKAMLCECVCNLYESALVIDDVEKYSNSLRKAMTDQCMSIMECATNSKELAKLFENASPYVKGIITLAEAVFEEKPEEEKVKPFDSKIILAKEDMDFIKKFEAEEGKDVYASGLQDRVIDVYKAEEKLGEEQKEKVQAVVDELAKLKSTGADKDEKDIVTESIEYGTSLFNTTPKTLFSAIFVNKSKNAMNESASADLLENGEQILAETIATYTLLETIHALGIKTYSREEVNDLKMEFFIS